AFQFTFGETAHLYALGALVVLTLAALLARDRQPAARWNREDNRIAVLWLCVALPLCVLGGYLQHTHVLRPVEGALHTGQATYGDLGLHLGIATSLRNAAFPPEYSILPGTRLSYPFLANSLSTSLMLFGLPLRWAIIVPGTLMMALVFTGYLLLARSALGPRRWLVALAMLLFFVNGGLGFLYAFDMVGQDFSRVADIFTGFYKTPANQPELNLRWSNVIADLMLPQRTLLGGWTLLLPALYLLRSAIQTRRTRQFFFAAVFAGALPLVHTHSFLALGLCSAGWMVCAIIQARGPAERRQLLSGGALYLLITLALALPQLIAFAFPQTMAGGSLRVQLNWVNNSRNLGMIDGYLWFWIKNVGPAFVLLLCAVLDADRRRALLAAGAFAIYLVAEVVLFQPNEYDNNKLFYVWYMIGALLVADYVGLLWDRLAGLRGRWVLAAAFVIVSTASGGLSIAREVVSDYRLFSADAVAAAEFVERETAPDAMFITTSEWHINPVSVLAGRRIVCGPNLYLYFHGLDSVRRERAADVRRFYTDPAGNLDVLERHGVDYILLGDYERGDYQPDQGAFDALFETIFSEGDYTIYRVPREAPLPPPEPHGPDAAQVAAQTPEPTRVPVQTVAPTGAPPPAQTGALDGAWPERR
ncbi:MAG: hypothetical protein FWE77_04560, partial [Clostridia bacterium]|nr:hypothetical protein [Clostridia bacterium]